MVRRPIAALATGRWAARAHSASRRQLRESGISPRPVLEPPTTSDSSLGFVVDLVLRTRRATCLEQALVRQAWLAARGERRDVIIGVRGAGTDLGAHAWLDGQAPTDEPGKFSELVRVGPG